jgi:hypothetical protein
MVENNHQSLSIQKLALNGWVLAILMFLGFLLMYIANFIVPINRKVMSYSTRIWDWYRYALTCIALVFLIINWKSIKMKYIIAGITFSLLTWLSLYSNRNPNLIVISRNSIIVFITFVCGAIIWSKYKIIQVAAIDKSIKASAISFGFGALIGIPIAIINLGFFIYTSGFHNIQNICLSALRALSPGVSEEIIFKFFVMGLCYIILKDKLPEKYTTIILLFFATVPHRLLHLPNLFITNPLSATLQLILGIILFTLPMAYAQIRKNLETAIGMHWVVDFLRFVFGF